MLRNIDRSQFLHGDLRGRQREIRPPWSQPEASFTDLCQRCNDCMDVCPSLIISKGSRGFPKIDFSQNHCTFCGDCVKACQHHALSFTTDPNISPWNLEVTINNSCLSQNGVVCRSCGEICEESAIRFKLETKGRATPILNRQSCSGCGECISVCPNQSISILPGTHPQAA